MLTCRTDKQLVHQCTASATARLTKSSSLPRSRKRPTHPLDERGRTGVLSRIKSFAQMTIMASFERQVISSPEAQAFYQVILDPTTYPDRRILLGDSGIRKFHWRFWYILWMIALIPMGRSHEIWFWERRKYSTAFMKLKRSSMGS